MKNTEEGFSLIELMVTLAIMIILMAVAIPSFNETMLGSKLTSNANDFVASLNKARSEAIKRNSTVTFCASTCPAGTDPCTCATAGGWDQGWVVLAGTEILLRHTSMATGLKMTDASNVRSITLQPTGVGATQATITLCQNSPSAGSQERVISVSATGRASLTSTANGVCS